jgi:hypothetical protein
VGGVFARDSQRLQLASNSTHLPSRRRPHKGATLTRGIRATALARPTRRNTSPSRTFNVSELAVFFRLAQLFFVSPRASLSSLPSSHLPLTSINSQAWQLPSAPRCEKMQLPNERRGQFLARHPTHVYPPLIHRRSRGKSRTMVAVSCLPAVSRFLRNLLASPCVFPPLRPADQPRGSTHTFFCMCLARCSLLAAL